MIGSKTSPAFFLGWFIFYIHEVHSKISLFHLFQLIPQRSDFSNTVFTAMRCNSTVVSEDNDP